MKNKVIEYMIRAYMDQEHRKQEQIELNSYKAKDNKVNKDTKGDDYSQNAPRNNHDNGRHRD